MLIGVDDMKDTNGFVTIATGDIKYYKLAQNLLISLKYSNPGYSVGIITDKDNNLTDGFDSVILLQEPYNSYLDKLYLLKYCPFDKNIFIDADSLVYGDISYLWDDFDKKTDFSCFGEKMRLDSIEGYFLYDDVKRLYADISYIPRLHGGLYYIKKGEFCNNLLKICLNIKENYDRIKFRLFEKPADEPIIALASSLSNVSFVNKLTDICFFPIADIQNIDRENGKIKYIQDNNEYVGKIIHFGNVNTSKWFYKNECLAFKMLKNRGRINKPILFFYRLKNKVIDNFGSFNKIIYSIYKLLPNSFKRIYRTIKKRGEYHG